MGENSGLSFDQIIEQKRKKIAVLKGFDYQTVRDASLRLKRHPSRVAHMAQEGRIPGAIKFGRNWMIPKSYQIKKRKAKVGTPKPEPGPLILDDPSKGKRRKKPKIA